MAPNGGGYAQCGFSWLRPYQPTRTLLAGTAAFIPLKPALGIAVVVGSFFIPLI